jgi:hypothetical protein
MPEAMQVHRKSEGLLGTFADDLIYAGFVAEVRCKLFRSVIPSL